MTRLTLIAGCVIAKDGKYLLIQEKRPDVYGKWNLPAGHVDPGETPGQAAAREAFEETGFTVELGREVLVEEAPEKGREFHAFSATIIGGELAIPKDEVLAAQWFTLDEIYAMQTAGQLRNDWMVRAIKNSTDIYKAAGIIIVDRKLLFARAHDMEIFIDPGGQIEPGETAKQALARELKEELSIDVAEDDLESFGQYTAEAAGRAGKTVHMQVFTVRKWQGEIVASAEVEELRWLTSNVPADIKVGSIFGGQVLPQLHNQGLVD